jgi:hypothetical protein
MTRLWYRADKDITTDSGLVEIWSPDPQTTAGAPIVEGEFRLQGDGFNAGSPPDPAYNASDANFGSHSTMTFDAANVERLKDEENPPPDSEALHDFFANKAPGALTMFFALKFDVLTLGRAIFSVGNSGGNGRFEYRVTTGAPERVALHYTDDNGDAGTVAAATANTTSPMIYSVRSDGSLIEHFKNGSLDGSASLPGDVGDVGALDEGMLGSRHDDTLHAGFTLAEWIIWDRKLTDSEHRSVVHYMRRRYQV